MVIVCCGEPLELTGDISYCKVNTVMAEENFRPKEKVLILASHT